MECKGVLKAKKNNNFGSDDLAGKDRVGRSFFFVYTGLVCTGLFSFLFVAPNCYFRSVKKILEMVHDSLR